MNCIDSIHDSLESLSRIFGSLGIRIESTLKSSFAAVDVELFFKRAFG